MANDNIESNGSNKNEQFDSGNISSSEAARQSLLDDYFKSSPIPSSLTASPRGESGNPAEKSSQIPEKGSLSSLLSARHGESGNPAENTSADIHRKKEKGIEDHENPTQPDGKGKDKESQEPQHRKEHGEAKNHNGQKEHGKNQHESIADSDNDNKDGDQIDIDTIFDDPFFHRSPEDDAMVRSAKSMGKAAGNADEARNAIREDAKLNSKLLDSKGKPSDDLYRKEPGKFNLDSLKDPEGAKPYIVPKEQISIEPRDAEREKPYIVTLPGIKDAMKTPTEPARYLEELKTPDLKSLAQKSGDPRLADSIDPLQQLKNSDAPDLWRKVILDDDAMKTPTELARHLEDLKAPDPNSMALKFGTTKLADSIDPLQQMKISHSSDHSSSVIPKEAIKLPKEPPPLHQFGDSPDFMRKLMKEGVKPSVKSLEERRQMEKSKEKFVATHQLPELELSDSTKERVKR